MLLIYATMMVMVEVYRVARLLSLALPAGNMTRLGGVKLLWSTVQILAQNSKKTRRKNSKAVQIPTYLKTGLGRVALLLLASIGANLASRGLSTRRLSLSSGHCCVM
jgi:hypothetical protein